MIPKREPVSGSGFDKNQKTFGVLVNGAALAIMRIARILCAPDCSAMARRQSMLSAPQACPLQAKSIVGIGRRAVLVVVCAPATKLAGGFNEAKAVPTVGADAMPMKAQAASTMNIAMGWSLARWRSASFGRRSLRSGA